MDCVSLYNNAGLISKVSEEIASENAKNCRINLILPETIVIELHFCCRQYGSIFIQIFVVALVGSERRIFSAIECVSAV